MSVGENKPKGVSKTVEKKAETVIIPSKEVEQKVIQSIEKKKTIGIGDKMPVYYL